MVNRGYQPTYCITRGSHIVWCSQLTWFRAVSVISGSITAVIRVVATFLGYLMRSITIHIHTFLSHTLIIYPIYILTPPLHHHYILYIYILLMVILLITYSQCQYRWLSPAFLEQVPPPPTPDTDMEAAEEHEERWENPPRI